MAEAIEAHKTRLIRAAVAAAVVALAAQGWRGCARQRPLEGIVSGNGRIEAVEIDIATELPGKLKDVPVREGDFVKAGQVVAMMDTDALEAHRRQAEAELRKARSEVTMALSVVKQREAELYSAKKHAQRTRALEAKGNVSRQEMEDDRARHMSATAALGAASAHVESAGSAVAAAEAAIERIQTDMAHSQLKAPRDGRVQYLITHAGEVLGAGGRVLNMLDLSDVYMTFFLPTAAAGRLALGDEARLVLDAAPQYVIPASVSFVASEAQFTPKTVETESEREKLMFRVKARIDPELLSKHILKVKTGLPGTAYVRLDSKTEWPAHLRAKMPP
ncbi:MAG: HlyD family efflux transporter periplasmic adaptor subunit [Elusimicrobia bacterium]|nr:HlyD family efflux transporter periplasmic adaptor subunit [Elusimicrobiota bacterium]